MPVSDSLADESMTPDVPDLSIARELHKRGVHPSRRLGQNFMIDRNMLDSVVDAARVTRHDLVLEIGTGTGFLTQRLCASAGHVVSVEIDARLHDLSRERLGNSANLTLLNCDVLTGSHELTPLVTNAVVERLQDVYGPTSLKVVANLPYAVATAVVQAVAESNLPFVGMWITVQKEVAERLVAVPGTPEYGFVSVILALVADIRLVRSIGPSVFWPRPKVDSALVEVLLRKEGRPDAALTVRLRSLLSRLFSARRKELGAALRLAGLDRQDIVELGRQMKTSGVDLRERVFRLPPEVLLALARRIDVRDVP